jgi:hypothetical protein
MGVKCILASANRRGHLEPSPSMPPLMFAGARDQTASAITIQSSPKE